MSGRKYSFRVFLLLISFLWLSTSALATDTTGQPADSTRQSAKAILFLGNSITAGYGLDPSQAFPAIIQTRIDSLELNYKVINGGLSGETSSGGLRRINWLLQRPIDILVLELGGNDGLRGIPLDLTRENLQAIIDETRKKNPSVRIIVAGMQVPPNMGEEYAKEFREIYPSLARVNQAALIPFVLEGVGGKPELNLPDGIHPTPQGHRIVAETVWEVLEPLLPIEPQ